MINRRQALQLGSAACASTLVRPSFASERQKPKRAVFLFIPMGSLPGAWLPDHCSVDFESSGRLLAPFAPIASRCLIPTKTRIEHAGFGVPYHTLSEQPFTSEGSLDVLISKSLNAEAATTESHLRLLARESSATFAGSVSMDAGNQLPFEEDPEKLFNRLQSFGLPDGADRNQLLNFDANIDSLSSWKAKAFLDLAKIALQTNYSNTVTLMFGGDEADFFAPPSLNVANRASLRIYTPTGQQEDFLIFKTYLHQMVAQFIQELAALNDAEGQPLLDSTMVYLFSNMGNGNDYSAENAPCLIAGAGSVFRTGNIVQHQAGTYPILNAIGYVFMGKDGLRFGNDIAFNLLR